VSSGTTIAGVPHWAIAFERDFGSSALRIRILDSNESITLLNYFAGGPTGEHVIETIAFQDGTQLGYVDLQSRAGVRANGTVADDTLVGSAGPDVVSGLSGNDAIFGLEGADRLDGGTGDDQVSGDGGDDVLTGGAGADVLFGGDGADQLDGGTGADSLVGGLGNDVYTFRRGSGNDTIFESDATSGNADRLRLVGLTAGDVELLRGIRDLARPDVTFVIRRSGSGTRILLDELLAHYGLSMADVRCYGHEEPNHLSVAATVAAGLGNCGLGLRAGAIASSVAHDSHNIVVAGADDAAMAAAAPAPPKGELT